MMRGNLQSVFIGVAAVLMTGFWMAACSQCTPQQKPEALSSEGQPGTQELVEHYCSQGLSKLAPGIPAGVKPVIERVNPYPALPDYRMFPDSSLTHHNAKTLSLLAKCVHQKCIALPEGMSKLKVVEAPADCGEAKANQIAGTFIGLLNSCRATRYMKVRALQTVRSIYEDREKRSFDVCEDILSQEPLVAEGLGFDVPECSLSQNDCADGFRCVINGDGTRCVELAGSDLGKPALGFNDTSLNSAAIVLKKHKLGDGCASSRGCPDGSSCAGVLGSSYECRSHCSAANPCGDGQVCVPMNAHGSVCVETCEGTELTKAEDGRVCLPNAAGVLRLSFDDSFVDALLAGDTKAVMTDESIRQAVASFPAAGECGNGKIEFPEQCDAGEANGKPFYGDWCSTDCKLAECGNGRLEGAESCECLSGWAQHRLTKGIELKHKTVCPFSYAQSTGIEKGIGWICTSDCQMTMPPQNLMGRRPVSNDHYLPEFLCVEPLNAQGEIRPECRPTNWKELDEKFRQAAEGKAPQEAPSE